ncbi:ribosomal protection-like ABC-F family protein [Lederbergia wuyishanensis]|uniref:ATPase subunit of ABC transporter with duplicated ATPase domains n=1 Tax=Lederbergia wuyishanensis TaxID=1347903 RepID=A0ABU0D694_9BACI|nr:ABC-F type ribosomal protection protein [Lederbergia wuyishanensis]MCJ8008644.1 ABC-F type ribosomal protection protein [Lederbergia wuyishanensis]MDQ0343938.1 ATPase subunit of ABC transporter with duplicated ATPase domains [Lederbergia wuyishanensis]
MLACSVNQISKMYGGNSIFENITFEIIEKERVGLVGRNGSGKTTLLKLLAGLESPDSGQIHWKKGSQIGYLSQIPEYQNELMIKEVLLTAFEELLQIEKKIQEFELNMSNETNNMKLERLIADYGNVQDDFALKGGYEIDANIEKIVNGLNIADLLDKPCSALSGGEKTKVGLALSLLKNPDFLLLDEPTNHLDLLAVEWLGNFLRDYSGTVLVISHDRYFLDEVVNKILDLEDGEIDCYHTSFSDYVKEKEERLLREFQAYQEQQKKIKKMKEAIKRLREWANRANPPNEGLHKRARNMERALERMEKLNRPILNRKKMNLEMESSVRSGNDVMTLQNVSKSFGEKLLFKEVNMNIAYQERVAIIGENGAGKSTLIKMIIEQIYPDEGEVRLGSNVKIGYLSQHIFSELKDEKIIEVFRNEVSVTEGEARSILSRFLFCGHSVFKKVSQLSGGERMRLRLAQLMYQDINFLILDEPTNHLDIESLEVLEDTLEHYNGTILAVSHDRYFLNKIFEKIYWIKANEVHVFGGNYQYAREKILEKVLHNKEDMKVKKKTDPPSKKEEVVAITKHDVEKELELLEQKIIEVNLELDEINDLERLQQLYMDKEELNKRWETLFEQLEKDLG